VQELKEKDHQLLLEFYQQITTNIMEDNEFLNKLWMSDEAHFHLTGYVNKQNYRYWADSNPKEIHERPLHSSKVTAWCAVSSHGVIGPYVFENEERITIAVTSDRYVEMLQSFVAPALNNFTKPGFNTTVRHRTLQGNQWQLCENCSVTVSSQDSVKFPGPQDHRICPFLIFSCGATLRIGSTRLGQGH